MKRLGWVLGIASIAACAGNPAEPMGDRGESLDGANVGLLPGLTTEEWSEASAGCEGLLHGGESFGVTMSDGLVVAIDEDGPLCVDTLASVMLDLEELGHGTRADALRASYHASLDDAHLLSSGGAGSGEGEPNPQPNIEADSYDPLGELTAAPTAGPGDGEPNPQPNMAPGEGEPNPQPNSPTMGGETTSSTSGDMDGGETTSSAGATAVGSVAGTTAS